MRWLGVKHCHVGLGHLNYFTSRSLARLLRRHGFVRVVSQTRGFNPVTLWHDWRGRGLAEQWGPSDCLHLEKRNATLRQIGVVRQIERLVDCGCASWRWGSAGRPRGEVEPRWNQTASHGGINGLENMKQWSR